MAKQQINNFQQLNTVLSQANAGTAGGTIRYINDGGVKRAWGLSAVYSCPGNGATQLSVTLPTGFLTAITGANLSLTELTIDGRQVSFFPAAPSATTIQLGVQGATGVTAAVGGKIYWEVIGT